MTEPSPSAPRPQQIGFWMATALVVGNMIGSGIFLLPAAMAPLGADGITGWGFTGVGAIIADVQGDFAGGGILLVDHPVDEVLQLGQGLALSADQAPGIVTLDVDENAVLDVLFGDGGFESEKLHEFFGQCSSIYWHGM
jgi:hypothetical protein